MKKTLIALAALASVATSGAAFAQATITGFMAAGYQTVTTGGATTSSAGGFGVDTAELYITAKEDIGGGMTAGGTMGIGGLERAAKTFSAKAQAAVDLVGGGSQYPTYGTNFTIYVQNAMGKLTIGSVKSGDYISSGLASSGVNYYDFGDFGNFGARSHRDIISFDTKVGPIALTLSHQEAANQVGVYNGAEGASGQRLSIISGTYAEGALKANAQYFTGDNQVAKSQSSLESVLRLSGNYNLGVATVGAGMQRQTLVYGNTATNLGLSASLPMGALTLGAMIGSRDTAGSTVASQNGTQSSYSLNANYALSKRTGVTGQFSSWDAGVNAANRSSMTLLLLTHSF